MLTYTVMLAVLFFARFLPDKKAPCQTKHILGGNKKWKHTTI